MTKQNWTNTSLRKFFRLFDVRAKEFSAELGMEPKMIDRMLYTNLDLSCYEEMLDAYFLAKCSARIQMHEAMVEYYKSVRL